jgi:hypothetical protein
MNKYDYKTELKANLRLATLKSTQVEGKTTAFKRTIRKIKHCGRPSLFR